MAKKKKKNGAMKKDHLQKSAKKRDRGDWPLRGLSW